MIFYFSGTGNTRWAAEKLAEATRDELIWIPDAIRGDCSYTLREGERIGFCFPVHGWRLPAVVKNFIRKLRIHPSPTPQQPFCYTVMTAGDSVGETTSLLQKELGARGITLHSAYSLIMPESYVGLPFMDVDSPQKEQAKKLHAAEELELYMEEIIKGTPSMEHLVLGRFPRLYSRIIGAFFHNYLITDKPFHVVSNRCVQCGKCAEVCPVDNIEGGKGMEPTWKHTGECLTCLACYHYCPKHAIEFGNRTRHKGQYYYKM